MGDPDQMSASSFKGMPKQAPINADVQSNAITTSPRLNDMFAAVIPESSEITLRERTITDIERPPILLAGWLHKPLSSKIIPDEEVTDTLVSVTQIVSDPKNNDFESRLYNFYVGIETRICSLFEGIHAASSGIVQVNNLDQSTIKALKRAIKNKNKKDFQSILKKVPQKTSTPILHYAGKIVSSMPIPIAAQIISLLFDVGERQSEQYDKNKQKKHAKELSRLAPLSTHGDLIAKNTALELTYRYQETILKLQSEKAAISLAEMAVKKILRKMLIGKIEQVNDLRVLVSQLIRAVIYGKEITHQWIDLIIPLSKQTVPFKDGYKYPARRIFENTGIKTADEEPIYYSLAGTTEHEIFGYRIGTPEEAAKLGLKEENLSGTDSEDSL